MRNWGISAAMCTRAGLEACGPRRGLAAVPVCGGGEWPGNGATRRATDQHTRPHWCGGRQRDRMARLRRPWAARPGRATHRHPTDWRPPRGLRGRAVLRADASSHTPAHPAPLVWRAPEGPEGQAAVPVGGGGAWPGFEIGRAEPPNSDQAPLVWRAPEGPEGTGGLRGAAPNAVRPPSLAGGRGLRRLEHPWGHKQPGPQDSTRGARNTRGATDNKAARPQWGRAAQQVSEAHRRITTMSGSPSPLSWRTLEMPSLAATSFAVPSMRGSS